MKRVLCFGDSNTFGYNPHNGSRYAKDIRWPCVLSNCLGTHFEVIEQGLNGRCVLDSLSAFKKIINEYDPLDIVIIFLGVNDVLFTPDKPISKIISGIDSMCQSLSESSSKSKSPCPTIILMAPIQINCECVKEQGLWLESEKLLRLSPAIKELAKISKCHFFDPSIKIKSSKIDGIHLEPEEQIKLGKQMASFIKEQL
ncbi:MAG: GDSL-type esterase/lipase family protein [Spirochaetales bacterium]|nr:GDSL-type esterase/lipase family protein [Spirochaetales bacterium]